MEASDMLDVIHYFFDEDMRYSTLEELQMHNSVRTTLFETMYERPYAYGKPSSSSTAQNNSDGELKPFIPATEVDPEAMNPFGDLLDSPIG